MGDLILTSLVKRCGPRGRWHSKLAPRRHFVSAQNPTPRSMEPRTHGVTVRLYAFVFLGGEDIAVARPEPPCEAQAAMKTTTRRTLSYKHIDTHTSRGTLART